MAECISSGPPLTLNSMPSEIIRLIVSQLAPHPDQLRPGCKNDLKNANLAHSCLRQWVPEYMFRDMAMPHVLVGMASNLELFAAMGSENLLRYVKHINIQVPPAVRWDIGGDASFGHHVEEITMNRLCKKFRVQNTQEMTDEQFQYCKDYYRALVEPFTDNRSSYRLVRSAESSWARVLEYFHALEEVSVSCCKIIHHPPATYTHIFILRHGQTVMEEPDPPFVEDSIVNMAWASSIVLKSAPQHVRSLRLSLANVDNYSSFATINRLLSLSYRQPIANQQNRITKLDLSLRGSGGTHGSRDWHQDTGSAGVARHWTKMLNNLQALQHLTLHNHLKTNNELRFSSLELTDQKSCIIDWILPDLVLKQLRTLRLSDFLLDEVTVKQTFTGQWPRLELITFDDTQLMARAKGGLGAWHDSQKHLKGQSWLDICQVLLKKHTGLQIALNRPITTVEDTAYRLDPKYAEKLVRMPKVSLNDDGPSDVPGVVDVLP